ncbi:MAG: hypothetical protein GY953_39360 [bacterium]|nr:hypothetical protein [bacterium]
MTIALVVFEHDTNIKWLRLLKRGYRHCWIALEQDGKWVVLNFYRNAASVDVAEGSSPERATAHLRRLGWRVVETEVRDAPLRSAPIALLNCVEIVKRILGIHARWVVTPYQLYRYLKRG